MNRLKAFWGCEAGASAAEYALILAIVGSAMAAGAIFLGQVIATSVNDTGECIQDSAAC
jgi:pilus assembly protein Flp/PilA